MNRSKIYKSIASTFVLSILALSCTKLDQKVYSVVPNDQFWQTPEQIAAGIAPAYQSLQGLYGGAANVFNIIEVSSDELIAPTRGGDWYDGGVWQALWLHTWTPSLGIINDSWQDIYAGIGKINFILSIVNNLSEKPADIDNINAELKTLRAYYYFLAMDIFGNVPLVTDFNTDPNTVTNATRSEVFDFIESDLKENLPLLSDEVSEATYGRVTKYMSFSLLAKLYLNAEVYTGTQRWSDCVAMCDSIIESGKYSLEPDYFDNFSVSNEGSNENIFVVPYDNINIGGNNWGMNTLHYQSQATFGMTDGPYNGYCAVAAFYSKFDTTSDYTDKGGNLYRTFHDMRSGQFLYGQQFNELFSYPPYKDVLYASSDESLKIKDAGSDLDLFFSPDVETISDPSPAFRMAGVRNIKYFPQSGASSDQSNDLVIFRLADIYLMKAEASFRAGVDQGGALSAINLVRERAYGGDNTHDWVASDLTLDNILDERAREMTWENWRRNDLVRFGRYGNARTPDKQTDPSDGHLNLFPIPTSQISANPHLIQNPNY